MNNFIAVNLFIKHLRLNKFLAVKRSKNDMFFGGMYALPGGRIEKDENIPACAKRELFEETGAILLDVGKKPAMVTGFEYNGKEYGIGVFDATIKHQETFQPNDQDIDEVLWIEPNVFINSLILYKYPHKEIDRFKEFLITPRLSSPNN